MRAVLLAALVGSVLPLCAVAESETVSFPYYGVGSLTCGEWQEARREGNDEAFLEWMAGYLSGYLQGTGEFTSESVGTLQELAWSRCMGKPSRLVVSAAADALRKLMK